MNAAGAAYYTAIQAQYAYFNDLVGKMEDALHITRDTDQNTATALKKPDTLLK